jgi:hypothetical protein
MSRRYIVFEFKYQTRVVIPPEVYRLACRALNKHYTGEETIPLDVDTDKIHKKLRDAHNTLASEHIVNFRVVVYSNGAIDILDSL